MSRRTRLDPIRPSPAMPSCMGLSVAMSLSLALECAVVPDERVGRRVVAQLGLGGALELGEDRHCQGLSQLDAPLVERVDTPDGPLGEHAVLVQRDQRAEGLWGQL